MAFVPIDLIKLIGFTGGRERGLSDSSSVVRCLMHPLTVQVFGLADQSLTYELVLIFVIIKKKKKKNPTRQHLIPIMMATMKKIENKW